MVTFSRARGAEEIEARTKKRSDYQRNNERMAARIASRARTASSGACSEGRAGDGGVQHVSERDSRQGMPSAARRSISTTTVVETTLSQFTQ
jgi:hypothetical protein